MSKFEKNAQNYPANFINVLQNQRWILRTETDTDPFPVEWYCESIDILLGKTDISQCL